MSDTYTTQNYSDADLESVLLVALDAARYDRVDPESAVESFPDRGSVLAAMQREIAIVIVDASSLVVGFGNVRYWDEDDGTYLYLHEQSILPSARTTKAPKLLLAEIQKRIDTLAATHDNTAGAPNVYGANAAEPEKDIINLLLTDGYKQVWSQVEMQFDALDTLPQEAKPPKGFQDEPVSVDDNEMKRAVYRANKAVYKGQFGSSSESEDDYEDFLEDNPTVSLWFVCASIESKEVAGFVLCEIDGTHAEVTEVTVVDKPEFRRKGLATYLMQKALRALHDQGVKVVHLQTDAEGKKGGRQLYEKLGFKPLKEHYRYRKKMSNWV